MKLVITSESDEVGYQKLTYKLLSKNNKLLHELEFIDSDSPEDNNLARNFSDCYQITDMIEKAVSQALKGDTVLEILEDDVVSQDYDEGDDY